MPIAEQHIRAPRQLNPVVGGNLMKLQNRIHYPVWGRGNVDEGEYIRPFPVLRDFAKDNPAPFVKRTFNTMVGIEVEHEAFSYEVANDLMHPTMWSLHDDSSLRGGCEYVTRMGFRAYGIGDGISRLFEHMQEHKTIAQDAVFSERTSIHVHVNCRPVPWVYVPSILATYILFEDALFEFAGAWRYNNIFTVPVSNTTLCQPAMVDVHNEYGPLMTVQNWPKYSALNVAPLFTMGTIEFRQMGGTWNEEQIQVWVLMCACIRHFAQDLSVGTFRELLRTMKTQSNYADLARKVFGSLAGYLNLTNSINERIVDAKVFLKGL